MRLDQRCLRQIIINIFQFNAVNLCECLYCTYESHCVAFCFSASLSTHELLILHTAEAQEWASYLQHILKSSRKFRKRSILLYAVGPADQLHGYNFDYFHSCKCIVLLLTGAFMDMLYEPELQGALQRLLHPPHRVVALLCGVSEDDILMDSFEDWPLWRKLSAEDAPAVYVTTILESIHNSTPIAKHLEVIRHHLCHSLHFVYRPNTWLGFT